MKSSIFICYTPLHILIARQIIAQRAIRNYRLLYFSENKSEKNLYYFSLLANQADYSYYFQKNNNYSDAFTMLKLLVVMSKSAGRQPVIYCGNIKTFYSRLVISFVKPSEINTFDDGVGNIDIKDQPGYFKDLHENPIANFFFTVWGKQFLYKNLIQQIKSHFTIYEYPNVFSNCSNISLFPKTISQNVSGAIKNILLTSALAIENYMTAEKEREFYDKIISHCDIHLVIRHPRNESYTPGSSCTVSNSLLIAEDQIFELTKEFQVRVFGVYYSTVLINLPAAIKKNNYISSDGLKDNPELKVLFDKIGITTDVMESKNGRN